MHEGAPSGAAAHCSDEHDSIYAAIKLERENKAAPETIQCMNLAAAGAEGVYHLAVNGNVFRRQATYWVLAIAAAIVIKYMCLRSFSTIHRAAGAHVA